ncbi:MULTISPECIES: PadR family transcriptional regulator [unclassified Pseudactinotalea]|uniref:PadR family transcriptional regulator n=1 Tax=unclassified Pseudactinotalea TaxID=2649176 RepID=UPI00128B6145|nr:MULTISPECIES: PadR family transcriptional regulator [unclassified Pseudactinotalea]MPV48984.1 PadR family transcriptional regulator [Pseudactinotalea sp. HY160]QGH68339.1 PadR family transcriptional regulator [Pseudactinotalea sp. HY158]
MSVRDGLLATLSARPMHAYELRGEFERRTTSAWPLNMGQVTVTLGSLVKTGLAEPEPESDAPVRYRITEAGSAHVRSWWLEAADRATPAREEVGIKLALAVGDPSVDVAEVVANQRAATLGAMHDLTRLKRAATEPEDLGWRITLDRMIFAADAEVRWLDHVREQVARTGIRAGATGATTAGEPGPALAVDAHPETEESLR